MSAAWKAWSLNGWGVSGGSPGGGAADRNVLTYERVRLSPPPSAVVRAGVIELVVSARLHVSATVRHSEDEELLTMGEL